MKRILIAILLLSLLAISCTREAAENSWGDLLQPIGTRCAFNSSSLSFSLLEYNDVQSLSGIYYASFTQGEAKTIKSDSGKEASLYPVTLYILTQECSTTTEARHTASKWKATGDTRYETLLYGEKDGLGLYTITPSPSSPYSSGLLAAGNHGTLAITVELMSTGEMPGEETMLSILDALEYRNTEE